MPLEHGRLVVNHGVRSGAVAGERRAGAQLGNSAHDVGDGDEQVAAREEDDGSLWVVEAAPVDEIGGDREQREEEARDREDEDEGRG